jgi:hypothetical protein
MKIKEYTTTEFYNNPSKAVSYVRDGGTVYLGYKRLKEPIAVVIPYKEYKKKVEEKDILKNQETLLDRVKKNIMSAPEYPDSVKYIREQREQK